MLVRRLYCASCTLGVYSVYTPRRIVGTTFRQSETDNPKLHALSKIFEKILTLRQILKNATTPHEFQFAMRISAMMRTTETKYAASLPAALRTISILFFDQPRSHNLHFLRIVDSDCNALVCSDEMFCRAALFLPKTRLVVADCNLLFVIVLFPVSVLHRVFLSCLNHRKRELQMNLRPSFCSSVR